MSTRYRIDNVDALGESLRALDAAVGESTLRQAALAGARVIYAETRRRAPVGDHTGMRFGQPHAPGFLRDHILIAYDAETSVPGRLASYVITWSREAFYGRFLEHGKTNVTRLSRGTLAQAIEAIEHGSSRTSAQPFLRPAFDATKAEAAARVAALIDAKLKEAGNGQ